MKKRPLSPHLQIYKPQLTSVLSILHRFSAVLMLGGLMALVGYFTTLVLLPTFFTMVHSFLTSLTGKILVSLFLLVFWFFVGTSIRYLVWDTGRGFSLQEVYASGQFAVLMTFVLTAFTILALWGKLI
ncbi:MAG: succinate dehydrogenase, cytochrome b556 subunit [Rickettsiales bacterium]|nr:succinate dehydrogenase, cytochrome b556 subunit [Rickettsiales bacterium]